MQCASRCKEGTRLTLNEADGKMISQLVMVPRLSDEGQQRNLRDGRWYDLKAELEPILERERDRIRHVGRNALNAAEERWLQNVEIMLTQVSMLAVRAQT